MLHSHAALTIHIRCAACGEPLSSFSKRGDVAMPRGRYRLCTSKRRLVTTLAQEPADREAYYAPLDDYRVRTWERIAYPTPCAKLWEYAYTCNQDACTEQLVVDPAWSDNPAAGAPGFELVPIEAFYTSAAALQ